MRTMREEENHNKVEQPRKLVKGWDFSSHYTCHHKKKSRKDRTREKRENSLKLWPGGRERRRERRGRGGVCVCQRDHSPSAIKTAAKVNLCLIDQRLLTFCSQSSDGRSHRPSK